ncbi:MAG: sigma-54-dependent Fis family transcriptional regulator [Nitrospinota bacterium]|nr:MAG: sigma-54-dependent Fis family transcriptional regulator [Nitrospinota bacterium]
MKMESRNPRSASLLVVDNACVERSMLVQWLTREGYQVDEATSPGEAIQKLEQQRYDVVITERSLDGEGDLGLLKASRVHAPHTAVILLATSGSIDSAVEAMRLGACDYLTKPVSRQKLRDTIRQAVQRQKPRTTSLALPESPSHRYRAQGIIVTSPKMLAVLEAASLVAQTSANVLIQGESGTGKELLARAIHAWSDRASGPFIPIDCGALAETLLENELFGHVKGAFTGSLVLKRGLFEEGQGGTIFLDEIGVMPVALQMKLLRVLQERMIRRIGSTTPTSIDVRILTATNQDLKTLVAQGDFRADLYYRFNGVVLTLPPLRERQEDILVLAPYFVQHFSQQVGKPMRGVSAEAMTILLHHSWPGNVRELQNVIERAVIFSRSEWLLPEALPPELLRQEGANVSRPPGSMTLAELEKTHILAVLYKHHGNQTQTAKALGISRATLWQKMKKYGISARQIAVQHR